MENTSGKNHLYTWKNPLVQMGFGQTQVDFGKTQVGFEQNTS